MSRAERQEARGRVRAFLAAATVAATMSLIASACATGGSRIDTTDDGNITETTVAAGGMGGSGGVLVTASTAPTTVGVGGAGGEQPACEEDPCKVTAPQCGCPAEQKCTLLPGVTFTRGCRPEGTAAISEACSSDTDCVAGTYCMTVGGHRVCREYCDTDADCDAPGGRCLLDASGNQGPERFCSDNCDPITNAGCVTAGTKCELFREGDEWMTACVGAGAGTQGSACANVNDCAAGYGCLTVNNVQSCHQYCDVANPTCSCLQFEEPKPIIGTKEYGGCN